MVASESGTRAASGVGRRSLIQMSWVQRGGNRYYYRSVWRDGRVVCEYVGTGQIAEWMAQMDAMERERRAMEREHERLKRDAERLPLESTEAALAEWCGMVESAAHAALEAAGFHRHKQGEWRKRRRPVGTEIEKKPADASRAVVARFKAGDAAAETEAILVHTICGAGPDKAAARAAAHAAIARVRDDLAGPDPSPIERLLADRVALTWYDLHESESRLISAGKESMMIHQATFLEKRLDRAYRRYLMALKTLAQVRKLAGPTLQVNIARNQVNVAGTGTGIPDGPD